MHKILFFVLALLTTNATPADQKLEDCVDTCSNKLDSCQDTKTKEKCGFEYKKCENKCWDDFGNAPAVLTDPEPAASTTDEQDEH